MALQPGPSEPKAHIINLQARCAELRVSIQSKDLHVEYDKGKQEQPEIAQEVEHTHIQKKRNNC